MNIFIETISLAEIRQATASGFADGIVITDVVDSPSPHGREIIEEIANEFAIPVCVEVGAISSEDVYREAREIAKISDHIIIQLPLVEDAVTPMHRLSQEGVGVCANFVFNGAQAVLAAKAGASMVRVSLHDLDAQGQSVHPPRDRTGVDSIPVLVAPTGAAFVGEDAIVVYLEANETVPTEARAHRLKAEKARRRYLEEECECSQPATH